MSHEHKRRGATKNSSAAVVTTETAEKTDHNLLDDYKAQCKKQGEHLVREVFPKKVVELTALLESERFSLTRLSDIGVKLNVPVPDGIVPTSESGSKKRKLDALNDNDVTGTQVFSLPGGTVPVNAHVVEIIDVIKPQAIELVSFCNQIKMWIAFMIPKIEDGNNFGVSIQEDSMSEARQVESEAATYLEQITRYFLTRAKIVTKVAKYPHVEDYRRTVQELDEKEFLNVRLVLTELRNHYASLHDLICKNLDKIKKPRSTNTDNMY